jgi:hypothetical protein
MFEIQVRTEQVRASSNACDLYAGGSMFEPLSGYQLSWYRFIAVSHSPTW